MSKKWEPNVKKKLSGHLEQAYWKRVSAQGRRMNQMYFSSKLASVANLSFCVVQGRQLLALLQSRQLQVVLKAPWGEPEAQGSFPLLEKEKKIIKSKSLSSSPLGNNCPIK